MCSASVFGFKENDVTREYASIFGASTDVFTNLICILLSFRYYNDLYFTICGCIHNMFEKYCCSASGNTSSKDDRKSMASTQKTEQTVEKSISLSTISNNQQTPVSDIQSTSPDEQS